MIDEDHYFFLLKMNSIVKEELERKKRKKRKYVVWQSMSDDLEYIISYYEEEMDNFLSKYK